MIYESLEFIRLNLNQYLKDQNIDPAGEGQPVILENISSTEDTGFIGGDNLVMTLVNVEEESAYKNAKHYRQTEEGVAVANPPVFLNLYVLFSANHNKYDTALMALAAVIAFFQGKRAYDFSDAPVTISRLETQERIKDRDLISLIIDLYTLTFEQINHLWGSLGGKQKPFVMYKVRLVPIQRSKILEGGELIRRINRESGN